MSIDCIDWRIARQSRLLYPRGSEQFSQRAKRDHRLVVFLGDSRLVLRSSRRRRLSYSFHVQERSGSVGTPTDTLAASARPTERRPRSEIARAGTATTPVPVSAGVLARPPISPAQAIVDVPNPVGRTAQFRQVRDVRPLFAHHLPRDAHLVVGASEPSPARRHATQRQDHGDGRRRSQILRRVARTVGDRSPPRGGDGVPRPRTQFRHGDPERSLLVLGRIDPGRVAPATTRLVLRDDPVDARIERDPAALASERIRAHLPCTASTATTSVRARSTRAGCLLDQVDAVPLGPIFRFVPRRAFRSFSTFGTVGLIVISIRSRIRATIFTPARRGRTAATIAEPASIQPQV